MEERLECTAQFPGANTEPVSTDYRDRVSAVKKETFYNYWRYSKQIGVPSDAGSVCAQTG